jgi:hypothetical protein
VEKEYMTGGGEIIANVFVIRKLKIWAGVQSFDRHKTLDIQV